MYRDAAVGWLVVAARLALGLIFLTFGLNGFYTFIPVPELHPFMVILVSSAYVYVIKLVEVAGVSVVRPFQDVPCPESATTKSVSLNAWNQPYAEQ